MWRLKNGFWKATQGMGNYVMTMNTYAGRGVQRADKPFVDTFVKRFVKHRPNN